jgi:hypothetical protein
MNSGQQLMAAGKTGCDATRKTIPPGGRLYLDRKFVGILEVDHADAEPDQGGPPHVVIKL